MSQAARETALADRIEALPAYSGEELGAGLYRVDRDEDTASRKTRVILISEKSRKLIVEALRRTANAQ